MPLRLTLDIHTMTFGELIDFADAARASGADPTAAVPLASVNSGDTTTGHLVLDVPHSGGVVGAIHSGHFGSVSGEISTEEAAGFVDALETTLSEGGDARGVIAELTRLREKLRRI
ncbi:MAG TPA: hypothetical protein VGP24_01210 [Glaciihabitans sp.]|nr:hypothetical protein [Glaciihabitans sp.]